MKCRRCGSQASSLVRYCPGCGETLTELGAEHGQLVVRPSAQAADQPEAWFAAVSGLGGNDKAPCRVEGVELRGADALLRVAGGRERSLGFKELLAASAEEREWVSVD